MQDLMLPYNFKSWYSNSDTVISGYFRWNFFSYPISMLAYKKSFPLEHLFAYSQRFSVFLQIFLILNFIWIWISFDSFIFWTYLFVFVLRILSWSVFFLRILLLIINFRPVSGPNYRIQPLFVHVHSLKYKLCHILYEC